MRKEQTKMVFEEFYLEDRGTTPTTIYDLVDRFDRDVLRLPDHQRGKVWNDKKKKEYILRLKNRENPPPGSFETYQLKSGSPIYLNDGGNRIRTASMYLNNPELYDDVREIAEKVLRAQRVAVNHSHYDSHAQAHTDFILVNAGTFPTPYDQCKGLLTYMEGDDNNAKYELLTTIHSHIREKSILIISKVPKPGTKTHAKYLRHDYALLHRFISNDKNLTGYRPSTSIIDYDDIRKRNVIEWKLREYLEDNDINTIEVDINKFKNVITNETEIIIQTWKKVRLNEDISIVGSNYRFLLDVSIWRRHNNVNTNIWIEFASTLLHHTQGGSTAFDKEDIRKKVSLELGNLSRLPSLCKIIGFNFDDFFNNQRVPNKLSKYIRSGQDISHTDPVSMFGEGDVIIEPSSINRARGAKPIEGEN